MEMICFMNKDHTPPCPPQNKTTSPHHQDTSIKHAENNQLKYDGASRPSTLLRYNRRICSGLGDRMGIILNVAAFALSMNASCVMFWCEENAGTYRYYGIDDVRMYMVIPTNIILLTVEEFDVTTRDIPDIQYNTGALPATEAYDSVYSLAHLTMTFAGSTVLHKTFVAAYRRVGSEWTVRSGTDLQQAYIVLHIRQDDKVHSDSDQYSAGGSASYCTFEVLQTLSKYDIPVYLISDTEHAKLKILGEFGHFIASPNTR